MVPAPRGAGIVAARVPKKVLQFAAIEDVFTSSRGSTKTLELSLPDDMATGLMFAEVIWSELWHVAWTMASSVSLDLHDGFVGAVWMKPLSPCMANWSYRHVSSATL
ncbi:hypothetical protein V6N12_076160 [Hibiscus sabdariffa]|uniref:Small ribosomal subunit protein uS5 C-terminal domain-containing protein n=1 Tax=Hibiscus sabdariffa TaxID=183260 RepID=A0ABR2AUW3_9ROSI